MAMEVVYRDGIAVAGAALITHIGLVNAAGNEVGGARKPVTWTAPVDGLVRPTADLTFNMLAGEDVAGWRGYSALTLGTNYGGADLGKVTFTNAGEYTLLAAQTGIDHNAAI